MNELKKIPMSELTGKYIGKSYRQMPCLTLVHSVLTDLGAQVPDTYKHLSLENYLAFFTEQPEAAQNILLELLAEIGQPADLDRLKCYDLLAIKQPAGHIYPAINLKRNQALASTVNEGVCTVTLGQYNRPILARRFF